MRSKGKTKSFFADSQKNSFISGASTSVVATPRMRSVRASSLPLFSPNIARQNPTFPVSYVKQPARKGQNFSALSSKNSSLIDGLQSKVQSQTNSQFIDSPSNLHNDQSEAHKSAVHSGLTINESKPITPQIRSERSSLGKNSFRAAKPHSENLRPTATKNVNTNRFAADPKKLSFGIVAQRLEELKKFNLKLTVIDDYDKPVSIIQDESAKFARTMAFFNKLEGIKKTHVNLEERTKFARGPIFAKFLNILQDQKIPKFDQENFYVELAAKLREEVNKKNRELRMALEEHSMSLFIANFLISSSNS